MFPFCLGVLEGPVPVVGCRPSVCSFIFACSPGTQCCCGYLACVFCPVGYLSQVVAMVRRRARYDDRTYRKRAAALRRLVRDTGAPCWLCGCDIDLGLPYTHPMAFTADHVEALANGGNLYGELAPAHRSCNSARGKRRVGGQVKRPKTSRSW